jgi:hypothetical protein
MIGRFRRFATTIEGFSAWLAIAEQRAALVLPNDGIAHLIESWHASSDHQKDRLQPLRKSAASLVDVRIMGLDVSETSGPRTGHIRPYLPRMLA